MIIHPRLDLDPVVHNQLQTLFILSEEQKCNYLVSEYNSCALNEHLPFAIVYKL